MSASVVQAFHDAMKSADADALVTSLADDLVVVEPPSLPYGGTTTSRDEFLGKVVGYTEQFARFRLETSEVLGEGNCLAGHFTATFTAHGSGEIVLVDQAEIYEVSDGLITKVEVFQHNTAALVDFFRRNGSVS